MIPQGPFSVLNTTTAVESREIIFDEILVSDRIEHITQLLKENDTIFMEIFTKVPTKAQVIATFLAVLEMTKTLMIKVQQHRVFGDIRYCVTSGLKALRINIRFCRTAKVYHGRF